jgi:hypothetical protein
VRTFEVPVLILCQSLPTAMCRQPPSTGNGGIRGWNLDALQVVETFNDESFVVRRLREAVERFTKQVGEAPFGVPIIHN